MKIALATFLFILSVQFAFGQSSNRRKTYRCYVIKLSKKFEQQGDFFFSKGTSTDTIDSLKCYINRGIEKNQELYGSRFVAKPIIIYCRTKKQYLKYANQNTAGTTWITNSKTYLVLWKGGLNLDVIAHELCHAELTARVGFMTRMFMVPAWFDEGLAMQLDNRPSFKWQTDTATYYDYLKPLRGYKSFWEGGFRKVHLNYCFARIEVANWLGTGKEETLQYLLKGLSQGKDFHQLYRSVDGRN